MATLRARKEGRGIPDCAPGRLPFDDQCQAASASTGYRCNNAALLGLLVCRSHGGANRVAQAKHELAKAKHEAAQHLGWLPDKAAPIRDPLKELAALAGQMVAWKDFIGQELAGLITQKREGKPYSPGELESQIYLFERALERCTAVLAVAAKLNIDQRLAQIEQTQAEMVVALITQVLGTFGVSVENEPVRVEVQQRLRALHALTTRSPLALSPGAQKMGSDGHRHIGVDGNLIAEQKAAS